MPYRAGWRCTSPESMAVTVASWDSRFGKPPRCCKPPASKYSGQLFSQTMPQDILINWSPQETRVAVVEQGAVQELQVERTLERGLVGNVYLGKVARVLPGMQSAFIDIGLERAAFLHVADLMSSINSRHAESGAQAAGTLTPATASLQPIELQMFEGQTLMVQVLKDPIGTKGARLTAQISIAGRLLVFLPQDNHIGVSQKI